MLSVLFVCVHNGGRSQMAEAWLRALGGGRYAVESAGLEPGQINPLVAEVMREVGIDLTGKRTQDVFELYRAGKGYDFVVAVCSKEAADRCPVFPGARGVRLHWPFDDPAAVTGSHEARLELVRAIRDEIRRKIEAFVEVV